MARSCLGRAVGVGRSGGWGSDQSATVWNLLSRTSRRGETTVFLFDTLNRVVRQTDPVVTGDVVGGTIETEYDDVGNQTALVGPRGARVEFEYDDLNRVRRQNEIVSQESTTYSWTFDYDDLGNQTLATNPDGETAVSAFNSVSELLSVTDPLGDQTTYTHELGRSLRTTDPVGRYVVNTFDLAGRLTQVDRHTPIGTLLSTATFGYDEMGNQTTATSPRGNDTGATSADYTTTVTFDALSRVTAVAQPVSSDRDADHDLRLRRGRKRHPGDQPGQCVMDDDLQPVGSSRRLCRTGHHRVSDVGG